VKLPGLLTSRIFGAFGAYVFSIDREKVVKEGNLTQKVVHCIIQCKTAEFGCLNVNHIAGILNLSVEHISRTFRTDMGICLKKYLLNEKLNRAKFLLMQNHQEFDISTFNKKLIPKVPIDNILQGIYASRKSSFNFN